MAMYPDLSSQQAWSMIGVTPMIGVNDDSAEVFGLADAQQLADFAAQNKLGLLSMWSADRDTTGQLGVTSSNGSGVAQSPFAFSKIFSTDDDAASP